MDYIPPDIPTPVIEYVKQHSAKSDLVTGQFIRYITDWKNEEIYVYGNVYKVRIDIGLPSAIFYDCKDIRRANVEETWEIRTLMNIVIRNKTSEAHICSDK